MAPVVPQIDRDPVVLPDRGLHGHSARSSKRNSSGNSTPSASRVTGKGSGSSEAICCSTYPRAAETALTSPRDRPQERSTCAAAGDTTEKPGRDKSPERHAEDLARIYAMMDNPGHFLNTESHPVSKKDRQRIRKAGEPRWEVIQDQERRQAAQAARQILLQGS